MSQKVHFTNAKDIKLSGTLELPATEKVRGYALFAHCFTCTQASHGARRISEALGAMGIATLRFDFTGLGRSEGEFADSHFSANVADIVAAADYLDAEFEAPALLIGHSLGGAAVIAAAEQIPNAKAVITLGAPFAVDHVLGQLGDAVARIQQDGEGEVAIGGRPFHVNRAFVENAQGQDQATRLAKLHKALLVLHSPTDAIVGIDQARQIYEAAKHPKSFVSLPDADHLLTDAAQARYVAAMIAAWAAPHIPENTKEEETEQDAAEGEVMVESAGGKFSQRVTAGAHSFIADEPVSFGGSNLGPTPYDLLLAGLGSCTTMTIQMVAKREKIPLEHVSVTVRHKRCHSEDCQEAGEGRPRIEIIERDLKFTGDLDEAQRARLLEIADKCPVHRTLEADPIIKTKLVG
ncbi:bifunctional alpha/beta hydrolase/OsmC family protein [Alterisphingorhabdus coralli]|uniref:Alpha/beta fold hydrolase n=1 Tax=Alterisphingorhabdus coralli TaxID=3071408 RepID=A0AA97F500_9SPHN|nr:alpha/beta fold hydrolase [Parasphingorhabdus sp. SCSIO 66989]WOE74128.1 alpha/beta fold hydrolase [Parasphingorhabdus sp. SCSIO 66989]